MARNSSDTTDDLAESPSGSGDRGGKRNDKSDGGGHDHGDQIKNDQNQRGGGGLERVTVNLIPRASRALEQAVALTGDSKTDTINRALQVYAYLEEVWTSGGSIHVRNGDNITELKFF